MANRIAGITVEIGGDTTKLQTALKSVNSEIKSTQSQLKDVNNLLKLDPTNTELLTQKQKLLTESISETENKLTTLKTAAEQANEQLQNGDITQEQYDALQREIVETEEKLKSLADQAAESNAALVKIGEAGKTLESVGDSISGVGKQMLGVTTAVVGLGTAAVTVTADFETAMSKVKSLISSSSTDLEGDMERLEAAAREAGSTTVFSATEAAEAMSYMGLAGWSAEEMIEGLDGVLNLAAASEMDLATASDIVTDYLSAFGLTAADSGTLVDKMAYAMSNSNTSTEQLGEAYKNCAATATQLGYGLDETTAALMVMADAGIKGGEAGTALSSIMTRLGNNTSGCTDMLAEYGIEVYDAQGNVSSLSDILSGMQGIWADLTDEEKANLAYTVAGKTAQSELMTVLGESTGSFQAYQEGLANCNGTAENMAEIMQDNLSGQLTILKSQLQELAISFGEILMPTIKDIVSWIQNLVDKFNGMDDSTKQTIVQVGLLVVAIGPLLIVIGKTISTAGKAMQGFSSLGTSILKVVNHAKTGTGTMGHLVTAIGSISAPVVAVVAVIGTLIAAFATLWNTNEEFRESITAIWNSIRETISGFVDGIKERFADLGISLEGLGDVVEALKNIWLEFCNLLAPVFEGAFSVISTVLSTVLDVILGLLDVFIGIFTGDWEQAWTGVKEIFSGIWDGIAGILSAVLDTITGLVNTVLGWFGTSWEECWSGIKTFFEDIWNGISSFFSGILTGIQTVVTTVWTAISTFFSTILDTIYSTVSTVWNAISSVITTVLNAISSVVTTVWNAIQSVIATVLNAISSVVSSVWNSIAGITTNVMNSIQSTVSSIWDSIKSGVSSAMSGIYSAVKSGFDTAVNYIKGLASSAFSWGADIINGIVNGIKSCISKVGDACSSVASAIRSFLHFSVPDEGPLTDFDEWMPDFIGQLAEGIENSRGMIQRAMAGVASDMTISPTATITAASVGNSTSSTSSDSAASGEPTTGPLIEIKEMNVRSEEDIRKVSQQLYRQLQTTRRANGYT